MKLDRLTLRAKDLLLSLPKNKTLTSGQLLTRLTESTGMSSYLLGLLKTLVLEPAKSIKVAELVKEAYYQAVKLDHSYVGTEHLLLALFTLANSPDTKKIKIEIQKLSVFPQAIKNIEKNRKTPLLDLFGVNITQQVMRDFDKPLVDREEYNSLISVLMQKNNYNGILVGESGVGKKTLIDLLARNINLLEVPPALIGYNVIEFDLLGFITNSFNRGSTDLGMPMLIEELKSTGRVILSIKNLQNLFFSTNIGFTLPMFYSLFKSAVNQAGIRIIVTMNPTLYDKIVAENEHFFESFTVIEMDEPEESTTIKILEQHAIFLGIYHNMTIPKDVIKEIYKISKEKIKGIKFPQKGLNLLDQACSRTVIRKTRVPNAYKTLVDKTYLLAQGLDKSLEKGDYDLAIKNRDKLKKLEQEIFSMEGKVFANEHLRLTVADIQEAVEDIQLDPAKPTISKDFGFLSKLQQKIKKKIIGQDAPVDLVVRSLIRAKLGLRSKKRPLGNFLFLGPTGVGKTELAKVISDEFFGSGSLIRLDMSDFAEKHTVARLVGAPPGYVGYGEGGELTQKIEARPESLVLFDEIEKAHPDVLNILLQIMEEGELSDAKGNTFDFSKSIVILTSNLGTDIIHNKGIGFDESTLSDANIEDRLKLNLKKILKPELLNRFDETIIFTRLKKEDQLKIIDLLIDEVKDNLTKQKVILKVSSKGKEILLKKGYSTDYGARSLRRTIEKDLLDKIAEILLGHKERPLKLKTYVTSNDLDVRTY